MKRLRVWLAKKIIPSGYSVIKGTYKEYPKNRTGPAQPAVKEK